MMKSHAKIHTPSFCIRGLHDDEQVKLRGAARCSGFVP